MILRSGFVAALALFTTLLPSWGQDKLPDIQRIPDAPIAVPGTIVPSDGFGVRIPHHRGEWTSFFRDMSGGSEQILLINGQIENTDVPEFRSYRIRVLEKR